MTEPKKRIIVTHQNFGCDTGCCGHYFEGPTLGEFEFIHPKEHEDFRKWAEKKVAEFGCDPADLDWEHSEVTTW